MKLRLEVRLKKGMPAEVSRATTNREEFAAEKVKKLEGRVQEKGEDKRRQDSRESILISFKRKGAEEKITMESI